MSYPIQELNLLDIGGGGANEKQASHLIKDNQSAPPKEGVLPLTNCHTDTIGSIVKRHGYIVYADVLSNIKEITGLFQYKRFNGSEYEIATGSDVLGASTYRIYDISSPSVPINITGAMALSQDAVFDFAVIADTLIMVTEGRDQVMQWQGTGNVTTVSTAPRGKYAEEFFNYLFIVNTTANPERAYWSNLYDFNTWTGTDFYRLESFVTGIIRQESNLILFTRNSITVVQYTGDALTPFNFRRLDTNIGCISNRTLVNIEGTIYWLGPDGFIYRMAGDLTPQRATEAVPRTTASLIQNSLSKACAIDHKELRQYWCCVRKDTTSDNDFIIVIDYLVNEIFFYQGIQANSIANFTDSNGTFKTYFGDRTGRVYLTNSGDSDYFEGDKTAISYYKYTKAFNFGVPDRFKRLRKVKMTTNNQGNYNSVVDIIGDFGATAGESLDYTHSGGEHLLGVNWVLGVDPLGKKEYLALDNDVATTAKYFQFKISNDGEDEPVTVRDMSLQFQTLPRL